ncbi:MAG: hypothetical protein HY349_02315 [Nitrospirae bacterium]|nr:hypothetical protein [Nitrospirota bacterium]
MSLIRTFEAQVVTSRTRWLSFNLAVGDRIIRVKYGFDSASSAQGKLEHDLTLNLEYKQSGLFNQPVQKEIFEALERYDNVVVEEHKTGFIFKKIIHKIVSVQRGDEILFSSKNGISVKNPTAVRQKEREKEFIIERLAPYIERYLVNTKFEDATSITDEKKYQRNVVNTAWELLPFTDKLLGREKVKWDSLFARLREEAFSITDNKVSANTHVYKKILFIMMELLDVEVNQTVK